jgi:hypothetical protein
MKRFHLRAATAEVAVNGCLNTGLFPVNRNTLNEYEFNVGDREKLEPRNAHVLFVFDTGPDRTRPVQCNASEQRAGLSPSQNTALLAAGSPHKQIVTEERGYKEEMQNNWVQKRRRRNESEARHSASREYTMATERPKNGGSSSSTAEDDAIILVETGNEGSEDGVGATYTF